MKRKLLSLIALLAVGGTLAAWGYAQDGSRYAEPARFQPPATGSLTGQLRAVSETVVAEHTPVAGSEPGTIQQTGGLDWLLERKPSHQPAKPVQQNRAAPQPASPPEQTTAPQPASPPEQTTAPRTTTTTTPRGPAPVTINMDAAAAYRNSQPPASTVLGSKTTQFRPVNSRLMSPAERPAAEEPRVASRPLNTPPAEAEPELESPQSTPPAEPEAIASEPEPAALAAPQPFAKPSLEFTAPSASDYAPSATASENVAVLTAVSPQIGVAVLGPKAVVLGRETEYLVEVQNAGSAAARNLVVNIALPAWAKLMGADARTGTARMATQAEASIAWTINELASNDTTKLSLQIAALEPRSVSLDVSYALAPTTAVARIAVQEPKLALTLTGPSEMQYGETQTYTLAVSNPGSGDAENVILQIQPLSRSMEAGLTKEIGLLRAGERKAIEVALTAEEAGQMTVQAAVSARGGLQADALLNVQVRRAQLTVEVAGPPQKFAGAETIYQMKISNTGDATANEVQLAAVLPEGAELLDSTEGAALAEGNLGWNVGSLAPGDARIFQVICALTKSGENLLEVRARSGSGMMAGNTVRTTVEAIADLKLLVNDPKGPVAVGREAFYEIRIVNRGTKAAENVLVKGYFSEGIEPESVDGALGSVDIGQASFEPINRIEAGEELVLKIKARATTGGNHIFRAVVECEKPETRLVSEETTRYFETTANAFGGTQR